MCGLYGLADLHTPEIMLQFFKKIRIKLITGKKVKTYLLYAVGEVALVVIGILIALQINNWNEEQKEAELELVLLEELKENLQADLLDMTKNIGFHERMKKSAGIILKAFEQNLPYHDSLNAHFGEILTLPKFLITQNAYNNFNQAGMRIIRNDSLRNLIIFQYKHGYSYLLDWNATEWDFWSQDIQDVYRKHFRKFSTYGELMAEPIDYQNLRVSQDYINYLNTRLSLFERSNWLYQQNIKGVQRLIDDIEEELKSRASH